MLHKLGGSLEEDLGKANSILLLMEEIVKCFTSFLLTHKINITSVYLKQENKREIK